MSLLLPQTRTGTVHTARPLEIHGDRYLDVAVLLDDEPAAPVAGRLSAMDCPSGLLPGDRVRVCFTLGVMTRVEHASGATDNFG